MPAVTTNITHVTVSYFMAWWHRCQILGWISPWQMNDHGNPIEWFQGWFELNFWTSNYGTHAGCHLWLPYEKELKMNYLIASDIQQVDKSMFRRIGQHSTTTRATYLYINQSATEYRTALLLQLCVLWTPKSTGTLHYLYPLIVYIQSCYGFVGSDMCQCRWIQVS
jgi:hypothetical protein